VIDDAIVIISLGSSATAYAMVLSHFAWDIVGDMVMKLKPIHQALIAIILLTIPCYVLGLIALVLHIGD